MTYILGIDTSSVELGIGLYCDAKPAMSMSRYFRNSHAEHITQCLDFFLKTNKVLASDISCAGIAVGPGSFTGLRIGIAFLKGFFFQRNARIIAVSSLESMAGCLQVDAATIVAASDARNNELFWARFTVRDGYVTRITPDTLCDSNTFSASIQDSDIVITDTLGYAKSTVFGFLENRPNAFSVEKIPLQRGLACARIAAMETYDSKRWQSPDTIQPIYLNTSSVERKQQQAIS